MVQVLKGAKKAELLQICEALKIEGASRSWTCAKLQTAIAQAFVDLETWEESEMGQFEGGEPSSLELEKFKIEMQMKLELEAKRLEI